MANRIHWALLGSAFGLAAVLAACGGKASTPAPAPGSGGGGTAEAPQAQPSEPPKALSEHDRLILKGKEDWASCGTCHCTTDRRIPEDEDWVNMNEETT